MISTDTASNVVCRTDLSNEDYHADRSHISRSVAFRYQGVDGAAVQQWEDGGNGPVFSGSAATSLGSQADAAFACLVEGVDARSVLHAPPPDVLTANGRRFGAKYNQWKASLPQGSCEAKPEEVDKVLRMMDSISRHRLARSLVDSTVSTQQSVFWTDEDGHRRKARGDGTTPSHWYDLKTTSSEFSDLKWSFLRYGYHWQHAWYAEACRLSGLADPDYFPFIVVQTFAPYRVRVVTLRRSLVRRAEEQIRVTLRDIEDRRSTGVYLPDSYHESVEIDMD